VALVELASPRPACAELFFPRVDVVALALLAGIERKLCIVDQCAEVGDQICGVGYYKE